MQLQLTFLDPPRDADVTLIPLRRRNGTIVAYTRVDTADAAWVQQWTWRLWEGYAVRGEWAQGARRTVSLARELLDLPRRTDGREGDHRNRDRLDNRRQNLRVLPRGQNQQNVGSHGGSSRYRGVCWDAERRQWVATAHWRGGSYHLGRYWTEQAAARAAAQWRAAHMRATVEDAVLLRSAPPARLGYARGERHGSAKLTTPRVREIRARYAAGGVSICQLAREYGLGETPMRRLIHGQTWRHVA